MAEYKSDTTGRQRKWNSVRACTPMHHGNDNATRRDDGPITARTDAAAARRYWQALKDAGYVD